MLLPLLVACTSDPGPPVTTPVSEPVAAPTEPRVAAPKAGKKQAGKKKVRQPRKDPELPGKWRHVRKRAAELTKKDRELIAQLEAIGYAEGTQQIEPTGVVTIHDAKRAMPGANLYNSGHGPEAVLVGMDGTELHRWSTTYHTAWPKGRLKPTDPGVTHFRRVRLADDQGALLGIFEGRGIVKLDRDSKIVWAVHNGAHHDVVLHDGRYVMLTRRADVFPEVDPDEPILHDSVAIMGQHGKTHVKVNLYDALMRSDDVRAQIYPGRRGKTTGDVFHTNSVFVLTETHAALHPKWKAGNVLISMRELDAIAVVDLEQERFVWAAKGDWKRQHDATIRQDGTLMLFDNAGGKGKARVLAYSLPDMQRTWMYQGTKEHPFYSPTLGTAKELPNANVMVTESEGGRAFETTLSGHIVWEMFNPHRAGDNDEFIAALPEVERVPLDAVRWALDED